MTLKFSMLDITKFFFFLVLIYSGWFQYAFFVIPHMLMLLGICMLGSIIIYFYKKDTRIILPVPAEYIWWFIFFFYSFISGILVASNKNHVISTVLSNFEYLLVGYVLFLVVTQEKKLDFFIKVFVIYSVLAAITTIVNPIEIVKDPGRYTMNLDLNPNALGIAMFIGIFCSLYLIDFRNIIKSALYFVGIVFMIYAMFLTGSRKVFITLVILLGCWIFLVSRISFKFLSAKKKRAVMIAFISVIIIAIVVSIPLLEDSVMISRTLVLFQSGIADDRASMYQSAFLLFEENPIFGIGYQQFAKISGFNMYSHSTYAEALACTGLVGFLLYFIPYGIIFFKLIKKVSILRKEKEEQYLFMWIVMYIALLFLGTGMIHFYEINVNILFGMMIAFANLDIRNLIDTQKKLKTAEYSINLLKSDMRNNYI